jgi:tRNA(fMet)-specific endonuclease VapC
MVMRYLLDSNILIFALKDPACAAAIRLRTTDVSDIAICSVVEAELYAGARKYGNPARREATLDEMLEVYASLPFDSACVPQYARIRDHLEKQGCCIGANDLLIAAIALTHDMIVVTHDCNEFKRVPRLRVEDWSV